MSSTLHVANLQPWVTSADLARKFRYFGIVNTASVIADKNSGLSRCYGFIEMAKLASAEDAIRSLDASTYDGQPIAVKLVETAS